MSYKLIAIACCIFIVSTSYGQAFRLGITANSGLDSYQHKIDVKDVAIDQTNEPSLSIGLISTLRIKNRFSIEFGIGYNLAKRAYRYERNFTVNGIVKRSESFEKSTMRFYNPSLSIRYRIDRLCFKIGLQYLFVHRSKRVSSYYLFEDSVLTRSRAPTWYTNDLRDDFTGQFFTGLIYSVFEDTEVQLNLFFDPASITYVSTFPRFRMMLGFNRFFN